MSELTLELQRQVSVIRQAEFERKLQAKFADTCSTHNVTFEALASGDVPFEQVMKLSKLQEQLKAEAVIEETKAQEARAALERYSSIEARRHRFNIIFMEVTTGSSGHYHQAMHDEFDQMTQRERDTFKLWMMHMRGCDQTDIDKLESSMHRYNDQVKMILNQYQDLTDMHLKTQLEENKECDDYDETQLLVEKFNQMRREFILTMNAFINIITRKQAELVKLQGVHRSIKKQLGLCLRVHAKRCRRQLKHAIRM